MEETSPQSAQTEPFSFRRTIRKMLIATEAKLALKMGLAASISLMLGLSFGHLFDRPDTLVSGLWCVMASIVVVQVYLGATYKAAWARFLGVLIGSIAGGALVNLIGADAFSLGVSVFLTIIICSLLGIKDSFRIAGMSTAVIIVMGGLHPLINPWLFSFYRFIDSCIGILSGVFVARFVFPQRAIENIQSNVSKTMNLIGKLYLLASDVEQPSSATTSATNDLFRQIEDLLLENRMNKKEADVELYDNASARGNWALIIDEVETIVEAVSALNAVHKETLSKIFDDPLAASVADLIEKTEKGILSVEKTLKNEPSEPASEALFQSVHHMNEELERFRATRTTRKFNLEDVENYFVYFYSLKTIGEAIIKMEKMVRSSGELP